MVLKAKPKRNDQKLKNFNHHDFVEHNVQTEPLSVK